MFRNPLTDSVVVLIIVLLFMGPKRLPGLGRGLGQGMREFKDGISGGSKPAQEEKLALRPVAPTAADAPSAPSQTSAVPPRDAGSEPRR